MNYLSPLYRIYIAGKPMKHIGNVEARTEDEAMKKARDGKWQRFWGETAPVLLDDTKLVAVL